VRIAFALLFSLIPGAAWGAEPIAIETLFRMPEVDHVRVAPDGAHLAAIVPLNGRRNLAVVDLDTMQPQVITKYDAADVVDFRWIDNHRLMLDVGDAADASGQPFYTAFGALDLDGKDERRLKFPSAAIIHNFPDGQVLHLGRQGSSSGVFKADTRTGAETLVTYENPGSVAVWVADMKGDVRAAVNYDAKRGSTGFYWRATGDGPWKELARYPGYPGESMVPIVFDADNRHLIVASSVDNERAAIYRYDPEAGKLLDKIYEGTRLDARNVIVDRNSGKLLGVNSGVGASGVTWLDPPWRALQEAVDRALPAMHNALSWGDENPDRILVTSYSDVQPARYWLLDVKASRLRELQKSRAWIDPGRMTPVKEVSYKARDGLEIPALLALPKRDAPGRPPLVVIIHGGPHVPGNELRFNTETQFLASRGYAVLLPNFRGTLGYGRRFLNAAYHQWGRAMQDDITDGVKWAIDQGYVDPQRVCLYGGSYGGYSTLMGLVREPAMFRCGIATFAVTDPALLFEPGWNRSITFDEVDTYLRRTIGDPSDQQALDAISPLKQAKSIKAPVLLMFGADDPRVAIVHGTRMRDALEANGTPVEWVLYGGEGHGLHKDADRFDYYRRIEVFLARHLAP
jgi:dipeptidyl aminopeptidase/acylaminoacyl peptidase